MLKAQCFETVMLCYIRLQGPGVMKGYFDAPEATQKSFINGWLDTGEQLTRPHAQAGYASRHVHIYKHCGNTHTQQHLMGVLPA